MACTRVHRSDTGDQKLRGTRAGSSRLMTDAASPKQGLSSTEERLRKNIKQRRSSVSLSSRAPVQSCPNHIVEDLELVSIHQHTELPLVPSSQLTNPLFLVEPEEQERLHRENEDWRKNTLLNLPPPLPYDLAVEKLTIGVPDRKALR